MSVRLRLGFTFVIMCFIYFQSFNYPIVMPVWFSESDSPAIPSLIEELNDITETSEVTHPVRSFLSPPLYYMYSGAPLCIMRTPLVVIWYQ